MSRPPLDPPAFDPIARRRAAERRASSAQRLTVALLIWLALLLVMAGIYLWKNFHG